MTFEEFDVLVNETAMKVRESLNAVELEVYWKQFSTWDVDDFQAALVVCSITYSRFPTVAQIVKHKPKRQISGHFIEAATRYEEEARQAEAHWQAKSKELEQFAVTATWEQIADCFRQAGGVQGIAFLVDRFKKHPAGMFGQMIQNYIN